MTPAIDPVRDHLARALEWGEAHVDFDSTVEGVGPSHRGVVPEGLPYSLWQLLEHIRFTQADILEFCVDADYKGKNWPDDYWPKDPAPPSDTAWDECVTAFLRDREALRTLARDPAVDLTATIAHGSDQTYLRELLLVVDHNAYHLGQIVLVRRLLGIWPAISG